MLLIVIFNLFCLTLADPFHKYPYVFLLDVGNEEIDKAIPNQIRISAPGGSVALRYPAIGSGDNIAHVRVSGIDFGTDLTANIVEGGPGYNYVVLVLIGKADTSYDAVITIKTVPNDVIRNLQIVSDDVEEVEAIDTGVELNNSAIEDDNNSGEEVHISEIDENNSAEDLNDIELSEDTSQVNDNEEDVQETSNINDYVQNESIPHADLSVDQNDGDLQTDHQDEPSYIRQDDVSVNDGTVEVESLNEVENDDDDPSYIKQPEADKYIYYNDNFKNAPVRVLDKEMLEQYLALRARIFGNTVYYQSLPGQNEFEGNNPKDYNEIEYTIPRKDINNNFIDRNGNLAVAYK